MCLIETFLKSKFIPMAILFSCSYGISIEPLEFWMILPRKENEYGKTNEKWFGHMFNDELFDLTRQGKTRKLTREFHCVERVLTVKLAEEAHAISNTCFRPMPCYTFQFFFYSPPSKKKRRKNMFLQFFPCRPRKENENWILHLTRILTYFDWIWSRFSINKCDEFGYIWKGYVTVNIGTVVGYYSVSPALFGCLVL